jgi:predicted  nucleic acid-binding Zn-ribbon protein
MLARFEPGPDRVARLVLHPRLTFVPCERADFESVSLTFAVATTARIFSALDVESARTGGTESAERTTALDEVIEIALRAREQQEDAARRVAEADDRLEAARTALARLIDQRAQVAATIAQARQNLAWLERADVSETELRHNVDTARSEVADAEAEVVRVSHNSDGPPELREAKATYDKAAAELRAIEARGADGDFALDEASHQLELWAAQRANDIAKYDLEHLQKSLSIEDSSVAIAAAQDRLDAARARLVEAERALAERSESGLPDDPEAEATAIRTQIEAVERSLSESEAARQAEVESLEQETEVAHRDRDTADRQLEHALDRVDVDPAAQNIEEVLETLRARREELSADDPGLSVIGRVFRDLAQDAPEPLLVFVDPPGDDDEDLVGALISVSGLKRTVVVTDKTEMLREARELDPALGAVREPLETGGGGRQELARSDGNRT